MALGEILVSLITYRESFINISRYDTNVTKYVANWRTVESFLGVAHKVNMFAIEQQCSYAACEPVPVLNISTCKYTSYTLLYIDYILPQHYQICLSKKYEILWILIDKTTLFFILWEFPKYIKIYLGVAKNKMEVSTF